jgi:hypothetical protein
MFATDEDGNLIYRDFPSLRTLFAQSKPYVRPGGTRKNAVTQTSCIICGREVSYKQRRSHCYRCLQLKNGRTPGGRVTSPADQSYDQTQRSNQTSN